MSLDFIEQDTFIETAQDNKDIGQLIPESLRDKLALKSSPGKGGGRFGELFLNKENEEDPDVVQVIEFLKRAGKINKTTYVTPEDIRTIYNKNDKSSNSTSAIQKEIKEYFTVAARNKASDVHFTIKENISALIEFRQLGDLVRYQDITAEKGNAVCRTMYSTMCDVADKAFQPQRPQNGRIKQIFLPDEITGVRIATTPTENGYKMVCRLLYKAEDNNVNLESLGYEDFHIKFLEELKSKKAGVTIISGPTGSGKSTMLQAVISSIITETEGKMHVITVEDPPEYEIFGWVEVEQENIDSNGKITKEKKLIKSYATQTPVLNARGKEQRSEKFNEAIAASMRLDPDIIMIGEIRDHSSAEAALRASMTGHMVWTTVHANNALTIFTRLFDIGVKKELACDANIVSGLVAQRLVKKLCSNCSLPLIGNETLINSSTLQRLKDAFGNIGLESVKLRNHTGCEHCFRGVKGRTAVAEIIVLDDKFMELTLKEEKVELTKYWMSEMKGVDMMMHAILKIKQGICDPSEIENELGWLKVSEVADRENFENLLRGAKNAV